MPQVTERISPLVINHPSLDQAANRKFEKITAEVESLKAVLEMKTVEVRTLRNENVRLAEKVEEFDKTSLELRKAMQQVEDLKAQINHKQSSER